MTPMMTAEEITAFLQEVFHEVAGDFQVDHVGDGEIEMRLLTQAKHLRPGGTVSGPSMFGLADVAAYVATLSQIGPKALTVTTNCSIDFMRKPEAGVPLIAKAKLLKLGKQLSVTSVLLFSEGKPEPVAHATLTYAIPPRSMG